MKKMVSVLTVMVSSFVVASTVFADLNSGLKAYYPFNGNAHDESGNGNHGIIHGADLTQDRFGNSNKAFSFNGVNQYIEVPDALSLSNYSKLSLSAWFYKQQTQSIEWDGIVTKWNGIAADTTRRTQNTYGIWDKNNEVGGWTNNNTTNTNTIYAKGFFNISRWVHVVYTHDGITDKIYIDGVFAGKLDKNGTIASSTNPVLIGASLDRNLIYQYFTGLIDDVRIYNRALSESEILELYKKEANISEKATYDSSTKRLHIPGVIVDGEDEYEAVLGPPFNIISAGPKEAE